VRIKAISLLWFRGAADLISIVPDCKSIVVYGMNGSGKSSFVDAVEFELNDGRIGHLAHEYSGKHLQNAVPNTHKPQGSKTEISIKYCDGSAAKTEVGDDGSTSTSGSIVAWDYRRTVLRQGEVVEFIQDTKGGKYSALLPLFGLHQMEIAAENLRLLAKNVESLSQLQQKIQRLGQVGSKRKATFRTDTDEQIIKTIQGLHQKCCPNQVAAGDGLSLCTNLATAIEGRIAQLTSEQRKHLALQTAANVEISEHVNAVRAASLTLASSVDPFISQKLAVLQPSGSFVVNVPQDGQIECPACGRPIRVGEFREHVEGEMERLRGLRETYNSRNISLGDLCDAVKSLKREVGKPDAKSWRENIAQGTLQECFVYLESVNAEGLRTVCNEDDLQQIETKIIPIVDAAASASVDAPPDVQELLEDKEVVDVAKVSIQAIEDAAEVVGLEALISFIKALEQSTREEIRLRSNAVITEISEDIKRLWSILHPGQAIEDVHLYLPKDADKAIDIGLKFYGKELDSPRLTLSEGYRNSLGLCIFLAMAKREAINDSPVILDDVVISLDREHRGMIVDLLRQEFGGRQVMILTHDRDWYTELRQRLDDGNWLFRALLPYATPKTGIRWSHKTTTFDDARGHLSDRPDSSGNDARKIMDVELALISERLQIRLPYLRFDKNDRRTAHEFLERLIADGKRCFQKRTGVDFSTHEVAIKLLREADQLLVSWGNVASHTFDVVRPEATKLINACESALESFKCASCGKGVWFAEAGQDEWVQCQCGEIRWRYGKT
jgi:hypothetical protein